MADVLATFGVVVFFAIVIAFVTKRVPASVRPWVWLAFAEYMVCALIQYFFGGDAKYYEAIGAELAKFFDRSFVTTATELTALVLHRPSEFDTLVVLPGTNTGSMFAASAWLIFLSGGSPYAVHATIAGLSMLGALGIFRTAHDLCPKVSPVALFVATVAFPSVAFWTSNLHKESFCLMGVGLLLAALRAVKSGGYFRAIVFTAPGVVLVTMFRPAAIPPLVIGFAIFFVVTRIQKTRGTAGKLLVAPVYLALGLAATAIAVIALGKYIPTLAIENIVESVATQQAAWSVAEGGSTFGADAAVERTLAGQLLATPLGFFNGILRPQLFDVRNPAMLVSAIEMTVVLWLLIRAIRRNGIRGLILRIQENPFLALCTVITIIGCSIVGLTTRNMGSMARYRVPFLPFYGVWLAVLNTRVSATQAAATRRPARPTASGRAAPSGGRRIPVRRGGFAR